MLWLTQVTLKRSIFSLSGTVLHNKPIEEVLKHSGILFEDRGTAIKRNELFDLHSPLSFKFQFVTHYHEIGQLHFLLQ